MATPKKIRKIRAWGRGVSHKRPKEILKERRINPDLAIDIQSTLNKSHLSKDIQEDVLDIVREIANQQITRKEGFNLLNEQNPELAQWQTNLAEELLSLFNKYKQEK